VESLPRGSGEVDLLRRGRVRRALSQGQARRTPEERREPPRLVGLFPKTKRPRAAPWAGTQVVGHSLRTLLRVPVILILIRC